MIFGQQRLHRVIVDQAERLVVALALFVLDDADLVIELRLVEAAEQMAHAVGFEEQRGFERGRRHVFEIVRAVVPGRPVIVGRADLLQRTEEIAGRIFRAVEHQMFEQVCKAGLALHLVLAADVVPYRYGDDRRLAVGVDDDAQPVGQGELLVGNIDLLHEFGDGRGLGGGRGRRRLCEK